MAEIAIAPLPDSCDESTIDFTKEAAPGYRIVLPDETIECDPISVAIKLQQSGIVSPDGVVTTEVEKVVNVIRESFKAPNLTDAQAVMVMKHFQGYMERIQKKIASTQTSSTPTEPPAANTPHPSGHHYGPTSPASPQ